MQCRPAYDRNIDGGRGAWRGTRDAINGIAVSPPTEDSDDEIAEAVMLVLEKDPFVDAVQVRAGSAGPSSH